MDRKQFLSTAFWGAGAAVMGSQGFSEAPEHPEKPAAFSGGTIVEPAREIPVVAETDVLVIGGGPAGVAAAVSAGRAGVNTLLVERYNHTGGLWTGGLVLPLLSTHAKDKSGNFSKVLYGVGDEIAQRLFKMDMAIHEINPVVDPEAAKYVLDVMLQESGVQMLYHCRASNVIMNDDRIEAVILESKSGRVAIRPKVVVDCTGDGDMLHLAGEPYDIMKYHIGLVHRVGNADRVNPAPGSEPLEIGGPTPIPGVRWVNMQGEYDQDGLDLFNLSRLQQKYRIQIWERMEEIRATPGYEQMFLLDTASQIGVRMSRILSGVYQLTLEDTMTYKAFDDVIGISGAWTSLEYKEKRISRNQRPLWQIPYRALLPRKTRNLLAAGRCFSFERKLVEDARIIGTCLITGQGAGAGAAVAVQSGADVQHADVTRIQTILRKQKVNLG